MAHSKKSCKKAVKTGVIFVTMLEQCIGLQATGNRYVGMDMDI